MNRQLELVRLLRWEDFSIFVNKETFNKIKEKYEKYKIEIDESLEDNFFSIKNNKTGLPLFMIEDSVTNLFKLEEGDI